MKLQHQLVEHMVSEVLHAAHPYTKFSVSLHGLSDMLKIVIYRPDLDRYYSGLYDVTAVLGGPDDIFTV